MLFRLDNVAKEFGNQPLFRQVSAHCNPGQHVGLIGRNGTGKTTLFDLIEGSLKPDGGQVIRASGLEISRIDQIPDFPPHSTVRSQALTVFDDLAQAEGRLTELQTEISESDEEVSAELAQEYENLALRLRLHGGYDYRSRTEAVLLGVGFSAGQIDSPCEKLSGGQLNRLLAARALLRPSDLLLLDEPTNHLDLRAILWLTEYLKALKGAYLTVSHDRRFLDEVTETTWEIENQRLFVYQGSFTQSRRRRQQRRDEEQRLYRQQQDWKTRTEDFVRRNIAGQKTKQAQSRRKQLERTAWLEASSENRSRLRLRLDEGRRGGALSFRFDKTTIGYPGVTLIGGVDFQARRGERIGILGGNGSGKTTLLKTLCGEIRPLRGRIEWGPHNDLAYFPQNPSLGEEKGHRTLYDSLREFDPRSTDEELRSYAALFLFSGDDIDKPLDALSGGERSRLAMARLLKQPANVLVMDEPTNHLDIAAREVLEEVLGRYQGTLLVVSHDLYFLKNVVDRFYWIRDRRLTRLDRLGDLKSEEQKVSKSRLQSGGRSDQEKDRSGLSKNRLRQMRRELERLEKEIAMAEAERAELESKLSRPTENYRDLEDDSRRHSETVRRLEDLYAQWDRKAQELGETG